MRHLPDYYATLGVSPEASLQEIKAAYRRLSKQHHPDVGGSHDEFARVSTAADVLTNPAKRAEYDLQRRSASGRASGPAGSSPHRAHETVIHPCPHCSAKNRVKDDPKIRTVKCGACAKSFDLPEPDSYAKIFADLSDEMLKTLFGEGFTRELARKVFGTDYRGLHDNLKKYSDLAESFFKDLLTKVEQAAEKAQDPIRRVEKKLDEFEYWADKLDRK